MIRGIGIGEGCALDRALIFHTQDFCLVPSNDSDPATQLCALHAALDHVRDRNLKAQAKAGENECAIFEAYNEILNDREGVIEPVEELIRNGHDAAHAVQIRFDALASMMESIIDERLRERAADFNDLKRALLETLLDTQRLDLSALKEDVILIANVLTPADIVAMDVHRIHAIVCETGGVTSHLAIAARACGIPAVLGCKGALNRIRPGDLIAVDAAAGEVFVNPDEATTSLFQRRMDERARDLVALEAYRSRQTLDADNGVHKLMANVDSIEACHDALRFGCEGIGLLRSEFLYLGKEVLPDEQAQFETYRTVLELMGDLPVTVRTLDVGGDKALPALNMPKEDNPFLGCRAIRLCLRNEALFCTQLRALYRASAYGKLRIMFPMIATLEELHRAKALCEKVKGELRAEHIPFDEDVPLGMMIEVPAAAIMADMFAPEVDFFSIGSNDLTQYTMAVDRTNETLSSLYRPDYPPVLRLISYTVHAAKRAGIPCCLCGEAAGDQHMIPLLLGLGIDEFSVSKTSILTVRMQIAQQHIAQCHEIAENALHGRLTNESE